MTDSDLAELCQVPTRNLNRAVSRNKNRFPEDFMFRLSEEEAAALRFQTVTSNSRGGRRYLPYAFTEHGVVLLASVLNSARAIQMSILVVRAFVKIRELLASHQDLAVRIHHLESVQDRHSSVIDILASEIDELKQPPPDPPKRRIGFTGSH